MRLDISIGPVQGFVSQSRRTRDLWSSSYLLSFLAGHAMLGAQRAGGRVIQPAADDDPLYRWASGQREGDAPRLGSLPNHFVVEVDGAPSQVASAAREGMNDAWRNVCDAVWRRYVAHVASSGNGTAEIWDRQVRGFWEFVWTAGQPDQPGGLLDRRKHWRSHRATDEAGDKCTLMHDLQELSGYVRAQGRAGRESQDNFWRQMRRNGRFGPLELRENERLSAIGLVKRLFPLVSRQALGWDVDRSHWPSTIEMAAETSSTGASQNGAGGPTASPPPFYALVLADGDRLGRLVGELGGAVVGAALSGFTTEVPGIVAEHGGVTVYAGGDDVLAMLPVEEALDCAGELAATYRSAFAGHEGATLSAAVVLAQARVPLRSVVDESHRLLDGVAKEGNGRDSLAVAVLKGGGKHCQWVSSWDRRLYEDNTAPALDALDELAQQFRNAATEPGVSGSLVYRLRDTLARLCGWERWQPGDWGALPPGLDLQPILRADISRSLAATGSGTESDARALVDVMGRMLGPSRSSDRAQHADSTEVGIDGLLLARFLADPTSEA